MKPIKQNQHRRTSNLAILGLVTISLSLTGCGIEDITGMLNPDSITQSVTDLVDQLLGSAGLSF